MSDLLPTDLRDTPIKAPPLPGKIVSREDSEGVFSALSADLLLHSLNCVNTFGNFHVALSGGTTGLTVTGSPITTAGTITLAGILAKANGGTGTPTPALVAGSNVTITGTWPNQTIAASDTTGITAGKSIAFDLIFAI